MDCLKNLETLTLIDCHFTPGIGISEKYTSENKVKNLKLEKCHIFEEHLRHFVCLFPLVEEFEMENCNDNHNLQNESENLLNTLQILHGFKFLKKFKLLHFHCKAEHDMNPDGINE